MKYTTPLVVAAAAAAFLISGPRPAQAQNKDLLAIQRDIYELKHSLDEMKGGQDEKIAALQTLLQQMNQTLVAELQKLSDRAAAAQAEQQKSLSGPIVNMQGDVKDLSGSMLGVQSNVDSITKQQSELNNKMETLRLTLASVLGKVEDLNIKPTMAPPVPSPEQEAQIAFAAAYAQRAKGELAPALQAFIDLSQKYPTSPYAPMAMYEVGGMYADNNQFDQAVAAYDQILEQFGDNVMQAKAQFAKAEALEKLDRKADAIKEYEAFAKAHPDDANADAALQRAKELKGPSPAPAKPKRGRR